MRATIEIGKRPQVFWLAALSMCEEHMVYYAQQNAFAANCRMFQAMVDAHNAGHPHALHYGAMAAVGGLPPTVQKAIADELGEEVARPAQCWGAFDDIHTDGDPGFTFKIDPDLDGSLYASWTTSNGNILSVRLQGQWVWVTVEGRRHGIPWRFLDDCGLAASDFLVLGQNSQSNAAPWCDGVGNPIWTPKGEARKFTGFPTELAHPLEDYPSWGDAHQQAGWAADRVYLWSQLGGMIRACASFTSIGSAGITKRTETTWPCRTLPALEWSEIAKAYALTIRS